MSNKDKFQVITSKELQQQLFSTQCKLKNFTCLHSHQIQLQ